ncbi:beta-lactamase domain protein [Desulfurobacterium thermolithotrophum DSM 11699]|uniref:Beta-lactamase domain protein n=1 Tax=Desulfurobacterium thermolithotrophum (strain DSM 11699 / BSA) TaxID=868864 RepID=F0S0Z0_DESTD|nr:MBL fold metallo-hydrolase [Desulfurobacterium thermolithotrophum]ADY72794.1 beta-lactamase domain protein [Desulfurobacterium thermolithotrophum DSM 11699]
MEILAIPAGPFLVNTLLVWDKESKCAAIVDPGDKKSIEEIEDILSRKDLNVKYIINTHEHPDHIAANAWAKLKFPKADLIMHEEAAKHLNFWVESEIGELAGAEYSPSPEKTLKDEDELKLGNFNFKIIHSPGHSPGSIVLFSPKADVAIVGDLIFKGSIGRYDLPMSNRHELKRSVVKVLNQLNPDTLIIPGHGPRTTVKEEINNNPFIREFIG